MKRIAGMPKRYALRPPLGVTAAMLILLLIVGCASTPTELLRPIMTKEERAAAVAKRPDPFVPAPVEDNAAGSPAEDPEPVQPAKPFTSALLPTADAPATGPKASASDTPSALEVALAGDTIGSLDFQKEKLSNVLKVVSSVMGVNVVAQKDIEDEEITIYLKNITPLGALEAVCKQYGFWYEEGEGYIRLVSVDDFGRVVVSPDGTIRRMMFKGMALPSALGVLSKQTGQNVACRQNLKDKSLNLFLSNVSVQTAVEVICKQLGLWYRKDPVTNYYVLMSADDYGKDFLIDSRPQIRVFNLKYVSAPQLAEVIALSLGSRVEYTPPNMVRSYEHLKTPDFEDDEASVEAAKTDKDLSDDIDAPEIEDDYLTSQKIQNLVQNRLEMMLTAEDLRQINQQIGFALMAIFMRNNAIIATSTDTDLLDEIAGLIAELDTPTPQVLIKSKILTVNLNDDFTSYFDLDISHPTLDDEGNPSDDGGQGSFIWGSIFPAASTYGSAAYSFIDDEGEWQLDASIKLLKDEGNLESISNPMVVAAQNSEAKAFVGTVDYPLVTGIDADSEVNDEGNVISVILNPVVEKSDVGVTLIMTPQINEDRSVTLRLYIKESEINEDATAVPYYDAMNGELKDYFVDVIEEESVNTTINIPAGHTLVLGGLVNERVSDTVNKVPFLGDIPLLGFFFKKIVKVKQRTERIFMLKPFIMMSAEESGPVSSDAVEGSEHSFVKERKTKLLEFDKESQKLNIHGETIDEPEGTSDYGR